MDLLSHYYPNIAVDVGFVICALVNFAAYVALIGHLESSHHALWEELGGPTVGRQGTFRGFGNAYLVLKFVAGRGYAGLGDNRLSRLSRLLLTTVSLTVILFAVMLVMPRHHFSGTFSNGGHWNVNI